MTLLRLPVHRAIRALSVPALLMLLSACATHGVIQGRTDGQPVALHYQHSFWHQNGTVTASMPDGEHYAGRFVVGSQTVTGVGVDAGSGNLGVFSGTSRGSDAVAVLMGDRGGSMHCRFTLKHPDDGLEGGGVGRCRTASGHVVDATF